VPAPQHLPPILRLELRACIGLVADLKMDHQRLAMDSDLDDRALGAAASHCWGMSFGRIVWWVDTLAGLVQVGGCNGGIGASRHARRISEDGPTDVAHPGRDGRSVLGNDGEGNALWKPDRFERGAVLDAPRTKLAPVAR
jgi:hypothetical protein